MTRTKILISLVTILGLNTYGFGTPNCTAALWAPACDGGVPIKDGNPYYACSGGPFRCCWYLDQNYDCAFPPPALAIYAVLQSEDDNAQCSGGTACIPK